MSSSLVIPLVFLVGRAFAQDGLSSSPDSTDTRAYVEAAHAGAKATKSLLVCKDTHEGCSSWAGMVRAHASKPFCSPLCMYRL